MRRISQVEFLLAAVIAVVLCPGRSAHSQTIMTSSGQRVVLAGAPAEPAPDSRKLTDRQRLLASETDQLLTMATELKTQVDMTSRNILSMKVVRKAEEIEQYAHVLKDKAKK